MTGTPKLSSIAFLIFSAFMASSISNAKSGEGPMPEATPSTVPWAACTNNSPSSKKNSCNTDAKAAENACQPSEGKTATPVAPSMNKAGGEAAKGNNEAAAAARAFMAKCCPAAQKCQSSCQGYQEKIGSCSASDPSKEMEAGNEKRDGNTQVQELLKVCTEALARCAMATSQSKANDNTEKSDKDQQEKNKGDQGGGMPQMPQMPQSPQEQPQQPQEAQAAEQDCTTNPNTEKCLCIANPRACAQGQTAASAALGPGTFAGEHPDSGDSSSLPSSGSTPYSPSDLPSGSASAAGAGSGGGGMGGGGGANAAAAKAAEAAGKKQSAFNGSVYGGSDGGGGGGGGSGFDSDDDGKGKKGKGVGFSLMGSKGPSTISGFTKSGGRTNWEKVKIRYTENVGTFMKDDAAFFCTGPECRKGAPANAAASAAAASAAASQTPALPPAKTETAKTTTAPAGPPAASDKTKSK